MHRSEPCRFLLAGINSHNKIYLKRIHTEQAEARSKPRGLNEVGVTLRQNVGALNQVARRPNFIFHPFFLPECSPPHEHSTLYHDYRGLKTYPLFCS